MSKQHVDVHFSNGFKGKLIAANGTVAIGTGQGEVKPYDMLLGALASCLYATFMEIAEKKKISYESVDMAIDSVKRSEVPTTLEKVNVQLIVTGADNEAGLIKALDLSAKYCSVYQTLTHVATMTHSIEFK